MKLPSAWYHAHTKNNGFSCACMAASLQSPPQTPSGVVLQFQWRGARVKKTFQVKNKVVDVRQGAQVRALGQTISTAVRYQRQLQPVILVPEAC